MLVRNYKISRYYYTIYQNQQKENYTFTTIISSHFVVYCGERWRRLI